MNNILHMKFDNLDTKVFDSRDIMGAAAAQNVSSRIKNILSEKDELRMIFAAAPSQNEFLKELVKLDIPWEKITAFHMDEYIGLPEGSEQSFAYYLKKHLFDKVNFKQVHFLNSASEKPEMECLRYGSLINENPIDIVCMGIGENGHIAFNDPPVADFHDEETVKIVELEEVCRQQQVNDGCFNSIELVPRSAITLTIPALFSADYLSVVVPGKTKNEAVYKTLFDKISHDCPATILRRHENAALYLDYDSYNMVGENIKNPLGKN